MNELVCVNTEAENLLSRIPIRDSTFFDEFFRDFLGIFRKIMIFGNFGDFAKFTKMEFSKRDFFQK